VLNAGVPATEVARRAGHSVAVLLKVYAHCIDGQADNVNKRIADALGSEDEPRRLTARERPCGARMPIRAPLITRHIRRKQLRGTTLGLAQAHESRRAAK
jgi:hypothetical protein